MTWVCLSSGGTWRGGTSGEDGRVVITRKDSEAGGWVPGRRGGVALLERGR